MLVGVIGAGAWGTALALAVERAGHAVVLWARDATHASVMQRERANLRYLPHARFPAALRITAESTSLEQIDVALMAVPAQALRATALALAGVLDRPLPVVVCAKGIEQGSGMWMTQVLAQCLPRCFPAVLSGPSFAVDVAAGMPTAVVPADERHGAAGALAAELGTANFRIYSSNDVRGVEIGAAAKNVMAIASGIAAGRELGASAQAALVARGFTELVRFGRAYGARAETLTGLSGLGDLVLTCGSSQSRNFSLGNQIGKGQPIGVGAPLAEGAFTVAALVHLALVKGVRMPIAESVDAVLNGRLGVDRAIEDLLSRPPTSET